MRGLDQTRTRKRDRQQLLAVVLACGLAVRLWGWWFPIGVALTLGPPGSILGDFRLRRRAANEPVLARGELLEVDR